MIWITTLVTLSLFLGLTRSEELPDYLHICTKDDPNLDKCMTNSIESLRPKLAEGIPNLNVPSLEPLFLGDLLLGDNSQNGGLVITARDVDAYGASNFKIKRLEVVEYGRSYKILLLLPQLNVSGDYNISGRILLLPISGAGKFRGNFTRCVADVLMNTEPREINGETHAYVKKLTIRVRVGGGSLHLDNLFNGDKALGQVVNQAINQNFNIVAQDIIPIIERALERQFKKMANKIMSRYTEKQIFPS